MVIKPLTRRNSDGVTYERLPKVTEQIRVAVGMASHDLLNRAKVSDSTSLEYLQEECLVHLIRIYHNQKQDGIVSQLAEILLNRSITHISENLKSLSEEFSEDAIQDVVTHIFERILDLETDRADFMEVRYWLSLQRLTVSTYQKYYKLQYESRRYVGATLSFDSDDEDEEVKLVAPGILPEEFAILQDALNAIEEPYRQVFMLYHYEGWQIESKDVNEPTISKHFEVTGRTIRNWLKIAGEQARKVVRESNE